MDHIIEFFINHWQLFLTAIVILVFIAINELFAQKQAATNVSPAKAVDLINHEDAVLIDTRSLELFKAGHIINSIRCNADDFEKKTMDKYKNKPIILVCAQGQTSLSLGKRLKAGGFGQVLVLSGGIAAWKSAGYPLIKGN